MRAVKRALITAAGVGAIVAALGASPAMADVIPVDFTWNPSAISLGNTSEEFTASGFQVADYAKLDLGLNSGTVANPIYNNVTETAILAVNSLSVISGSSSGFINGMGTGAGTGSGDYQLYFVVTANSTLSTVGCGNGIATCGQFTSLSYTLYEDVGGKAKFTNTAASGPQANPNGDAAATALATGALYPGTNNNSVSISTTNVPAASVDVDVLNANGSFWLSPAISAILALETSFINNSGEVTTGVDGSGFPLVFLGQTDAAQPRPAGGGSVDMVEFVPEPLTLSLFGAGLVGVAGLRRRRSKKA